MIRKKGKIMTGNYTLTNIQLNTFDVDIEKFYKISKHINFYAITVVTIFGTIGNLLSIWLINTIASFARVSLKTNLLLLAISDIFVLVTHYIDFTLRSWINLQGMYDSQINIIDKSWFLCKMVYYLRNVFRMTSAYIIILMTWERFVVLYMPLKRAKWCSLRVNKFLVISLTGLAFLLNSPILVIVDLVRHPNNGNCYCDEKVKDIINYFGRKMTPKKILIFLLS